MVVFVIARSPRTNDAVKSVATMKTKMPSVRFAWSQMLETEDAGKPTRTNFKMHRDGKMVYRLDLRFFGVISHGVEIAPTVVPIVHASLNAVPAEQF